MPLTRLSVYCTISENRNAYADSDTSAVRVLFRFRSYTFGRVSGFGDGDTESGTGVPAGSEYRADTFDIDGRWSLDALRDAVESTDRRGCGAECTDITAAGKDANPR